MVHAVGVDYCACGRTGKSQVEQLLERRFYPTTVANPKTAATFRALEMFELLQYESKITPYEFFNTVSRLTDNTGLCLPKVRCITYFHINLCLTLQAGPLPQPASHDPPVEPWSDAEESGERA